MTMMMRQGWRKFEKERIPEALFVEDGVADAHNKLVRDRSVAFRTGGLAHVRHHPPQN